jgi:hypothetical protein
MHVEAGPVRVAIVAALLCFVPSFANPESLGDAARLQAKKRAGGTPARTFSDADLASRDARDAAPAAPPVATGPAAQQATAAGKPTPEAAERAQLDREEKARQEQKERWRAISKEARAQIERAQSEMDDCRLRGG